MADQFKSERKRPLYIQLVEDIIENIDENIYKPGEKLPSIRHMSESRGISIMTVMKSYQELLLRGYLISKPQSGYYVTARQDLNAVHKTVALSSPKHVEMSDMTRMVLVDSSDETLIPLGSGVPSQSLLPVTKLSHIAAKLLQSEQVPLQITGSAEGSPELRLQLAKHMFLAGTPTQADDIIVTSGCNEALFIALSVVCNPGDLVAVESPCYFGVLQILQELGLRAIEIPTTDDGINPDALRAALEMNPIKAVYISPNCNNPRGGILPEADKKKVAAIIEEYNVPLIEDDSIGDLYFGKTRPGTIKAYDHKGLIIYCASFSKILAPAFRIGWIIPGKFRKQVIQFKHALNLATSPLPQQAIAQYLSHTGFERQMHKARAAYRQKVEGMSAYIREMFPQGTTVSNPQGGFFLWVQLPSGVDTLELYNQAHEKNISLAPGMMFSVNNTFSNYLRLNAAPFTPEMKPIFKILAGLISDLMKG